MALHPGGTELLQGAVSYAAPTPIPTEGDRQAVRGSLDLDGLAVESWESPGDIVVEHLLGVKGKRKTSDLVRAEVYSVK
ncbi:hypothetical protein L7E55_05230 [Pelotomaculum isophthalicicum JI]|uniref:Uncharacterized protein n=1 Tax=Pelotomaculum isophthalicicum JI TaxID=947010 RepID=A0A9X4JTQ0_9FIRM|nr:hypothetical protein [Pelotomaculum isophthalicicum]MDF9407765.1 hypothetical protein [Pelotomaculum isophthalicicum JI]